MKRARLISLCLILPFNLPLIAQSPTYDFFPINVGKTWRYSYYFETRNGSPDGSGVASDTGIAQFKVLSLIETDTSINWTLQERDSLTETVQVHPRYGRDTTFVAGTIDTSFILVLQESKTALHNLISTVQGEMNSPYMRVFGFPRRRSQSPCSFPFSFPPISRYPGDTVQTIGRNYCSGREMNEFIQDSLYFERGVGLVRWTNKSDAGGGNSHTYWTIQAIFLQTLVGVNEPSGLTSQFHLSQNYPNPFNPSTTIRIDIPTSSRVTLKVFDILGRAVATLLDEVVAAGSHDVRFNAATLPSGVYFYRMVAGSYADSKKLMILK